MAGSSFGGALRISTFGESHGGGVGVIVDGMPPGVPISSEEIQRQLNRRKPGQNEFTTPRTEADCIHVLSGIFEGYTTGTSIGMVLYNQDARSKDYDNIKNSYRPGHADWSYDSKYGFRDWRGSGRASGRETSARVAAGAVARKMLACMGIEILAYTEEAAGIVAQTFDPAVIEQNPFRTCDLEAAQKMEERIREIADSKDSAGGIVACRINGVPAGWGEPVFDKLDADLAKAMLSIGAVKGFAIGSGFEAARMLGSQHNDGFLPAAPGEEGSPDRVGFRSNHAGGVIGGISTGAPIFFRIPVKPTSSISQPQKTINRQHEEIELVVEGRHDPIICPRIVPVVEAMSALVLADHYLRQGTTRVPDFPQDGFPFGIAAPQFQRRGPNPARVSNSAPNSDSDPAS
ncbi:chorismate synthase [Candidatus Haliotispira prima]|uniref:Chorismate synthase n=1 Tax=Candidatus Haliotispira prima TaxID=3034016 RepID=A0ABY8MJY6_9SPIO|nr:chorismate synthase [Candidatus Haliotispira prima]